MTGSTKLFRFVQKFHQTIGIYPSQPNQKSFPINSTNKIFLSCCAQLLFTAAAFLVFEANSIFKYGLTFFVLISIANCTVVCLIFIWQSENTFKFIENCDGLIEKRVHSSVAYGELIGRLELFSKLFLQLMALTIFLVYFTALPYTFARYYIFDMADDSFFLFSPAWFVFCLNMEYPFNWKTPFGYLLAWLAQCVGAIAEGSVYVQFPNFILGSCWLFSSIAEDITQDVAAFNTITETSSDKNHAELTKRFCDVVQVYLDAKQCVMKFNQVSEYSLFAFFSWNMLAISSVLVTLQFLFWADDSNLLEIVLLSFVLFWTITFIFILCEPGAMLTNQFEGFSSKLSQCNWYLLSIEIQRMYAIFLSDTQNPIKMLSYANITCERETSKKIINKAFSYFMTIRKIKP